MEVSLAGMDEVYPVLYYGQTLIHSYYTDPMLPWIAEEILLAHKVHDARLCLTTTGIHATSSDIRTKNFFSKSGSDNSSDDLISFDDEQEDGLESKEDVSNVDSRTKEILLRCKYTEIIHVKRVYCKKSSLLVILIRETKDSPIFCHAFKTSDQMMISTICSAIEERIFLESKNGSSCSFSKLGSGDGNGNSYSDSVHFEVLLVGVVNMHNPNPAHTLIDEAVVQFNDRYSKIERNHQAEDKPHVKPPLISHNSTDLVLGSPPSTFMDGSREGSMKIIQEMRQRCNSMDYKEKPSSVRRRTRHSSEPSTYANNLHRTRIRLFQIGRDSIKLVCPNKSTRTCEIEFSNISKCMQGINYKSHFGIIANKVEFSKQSRANPHQGHTTAHHYSEKKVVCYVFKCTEDYVCEEIMQGIKQAFTSCATTASPMREFDLICKDVNAVSSTEALSVAKLRMKELSENERQCVKAQLMEINPGNQYEKLCAVMAAFRQLYEVKHVEHLMKLRSSEEFESQLSDTVPVTKTLGTIRNRAMNSFGNLLQKGKKKMLELQHDAESHLPDRRPISPTQKFKFFSDAFSNSAPNTPQKDPDGFPRSPRSSQDGVIVRQRSTSLGSLPPSMQHSRSSPQMLFYHKIFQSVTNTGPSGSASHSSLCQPPITKTNSIFKDKTQSYDTPEDIKRAWRWAIRQQIILKRIKSIQASDIVSPSDNNSVYQDYTELTPVPREIMDVWDELFSLSQEEREKIDVNVLHAAVEKGVTCHTRGRIWKLLRSHCHNSSANPEYGTESYVRLLENLTPYQHAILIDIGRTFPTHPMYCQQLGPGQLSLFNVLKAYSLFDKEVGYCQGLSFIAGVLLMHTLVENEAYELLYCLMNEVGCRSMYLPDMKGMKLAIYKVTRLLHDLDQELYRFFELHEVSMMLVSTPWFLTMFSSTFPINFVARVFDMVFLEGSSALFKVAICLLQEKRDKIMECDDFEEIVNFIRIEVPENSDEHMKSVISKAMSMDVSSKLWEYEVEYRILQEEIPINRQNADKLRHLEDEVTCLQNVNRTVTESNCGLSKQLHDAQQKIAILQKQLREVQRTTR